MHTGIEFWVAFNAVVLGLLALDLFVFNRRPKEVTFRSSLLSTLFWVGLSLGFNLLIWHWKGQEKGLEFLTGYLVEYALSADNIFIFVLIFSYFRVPIQYQHRVLFWGIIGAFVMRGLLIWWGIELVKHFHWAFYVFGLFLVYTGLKMLFHKEDEIEPEQNPLVRLAEKFLPVTREYHGTALAIRKNGKLVLTPLAIVLLMVESTDLLFALDSIPAIIAVTQDPFIVYTSNICAILGLRSLYFLLASVVDKLVYLKAALSIILTFIGLKMLLANWVKISTQTSLAFVGGCLVFAIIASMLVNHRGSKK